MCAPIPKGEWSWKYDKCERCGTKKIKHKGNGLCLHCWDRERAKNPKRKAQIKAHSQKLQERLKARPDYKEFCRKHQEEWRKNPASGYKIFLQRQYRKLKMRRVARKIIFKIGRRLKREQGVEIICDGCPKSCRITSPIKDPLHKTSDLKLFQRELIKVCLNK